MQGRSEGREHICRIHLGSTICKQRACMCTTNLSVGLGDGREALRGKRGWLNLKSRRQSLGRFRYLYPY